MPCICYGYKSGKEEYDTFIESPAGYEVMKDLCKVASKIMSHEFVNDGEMNIFEFRQMFVKCFLHMMVGCDENCKPFLRSADKPLKQG
jgi:hypothetical protein